MIFYLIGGNNTLKPAKLHFKFSVSDYYQKSIMVKKFQAMINRDTIVKII